MEKADLDKELATLAGRWQGTSQSTPEQQEQDKREIERFLIDHAPNQNPLPEGRDFSQRLENIIDILKGLR